MRTFRWLSTSEIPSAIDLRRCGWTLVEDRSAPARIGVADIGRIGVDDWLRLLNPPPPWQRRSILLAGVEDPDERARLVRLGFGEVVGPAVAISELEARAARMAEQSTWLPDRREIGPLELDLATRDCRIAGRAIGLHPREFALLWRLADRPGVPVSKRNLLEDVWQLAFVPETNSVAVHVFRLRAKLATAGLTDVVRTTPDGRYVLMAEVTGASRAEEPMTVSQDEDDRHDA